MAVLEVLVGFLSAGFLGFLMAWITGQLVAGSRLAAAEALLHSAQDTNTKLIETNDKLKNIVDQQAETLRESALNTQITNQIASELVRLSKGQQPTGGTHP